MNEALRPQADRLASLLSGVRGAEVLAELQQLSLALRDPAAAAPGDCTAGTGGLGGPADVGIWRAERQPEGVALRRRDVEGVNPWHWADAEYVPPAGDARRLVLIGESVARGWAYEPAINPAMALARQLERAAPGRFQCVDLAQAGATAEDLTRTVNQLPRAEPDIVVVFAGNNWGCLPESPSASFISDLVETVREKGYAAMRRMFTSRVIVPRAERLVRSLRALHTDHGADIVVVVPQFNLRGWAPPPGIDLPILPDACFARWHELSAAADAAVGEGRWADVIETAQQMIHLDGGTSPVPGQLIYRAAAALGDGARARSGLESSRDALEGLGIANTPRITQEVRAILTGFADELGFPCVDMGAAIAAKDLPELPDPRYFFDYCHLTDDGIELVMGRAADAILGLRAGTSPPGPGVDPTLRAAMQLIAAAHGAFHGQPTGAVSAHLRLAVDAHPAATIAMTWLLDVLEGAGPVWTRPAVEPLANLGPGAALFGPVLTARNLPQELWTLRECLSSALDRVPAEVPSQVDLLAAPFGDGHRPPNLAPGRAFHQATARRSVFAFAVSQPRLGTLSICYRIPTVPGPPAVVLVNDQEIGTLAPAAGWATAVLGLPAAVLQPGVNWLQVRWPVPVINAARRFADDAGTMTRGEFPFVLPVFGELFEAFLELGPQPGPSANS